MAICSNRASRVRVPSSHACSAASRSAAVEAADPSLADSAKARVTSHARARFGPLKETSTLAPRLLRFPERQR
jgi:hypothetical protein